MTNYYLIIGFFTELFWLEIETNEYGQMLRCVWVLRLVEKKKDGSYIEKDELYTLTLWCEEGFDSCDDDYIEGKYIFKEIYYEKNMTSIKNEEIIELFNIMLKPKNNTYIEINSNGRIDDINNNVIKFSVTGYLQIEFENLVRNESYKNKINVNYYDLEYKILIEIMEYMINKKEEDDEDDNEDNNFKIVHPNPIPRYMEESSDSQYILLAYYTYTDDIYLDIIDYLINKGKKVPAKWFKKAAKLFEKKVLFEWFKRCVKLYGKNALENFMDLSLISDEEKHLLKILYDEQNEKAHQSVQNQTEKICFIDNNSKNIANDGLEIIKKDEENLPQVECVEDLIKNMENLSQEKCFEYLKKNMLSILALNANELKNIKYIFEYTYLEKIINEYIKNQYNIDFDIVIVLIDFTFNPELINKLISMTNIDNFDKLLAVISNISDSNNNNIKLELLNKYIQFFETVDNILDFCKLVNINYYENKDVIATMLKSDTFKKIINNDSNILMDINMSLLGQDKN